MKKGKSVFKVRRWANVLPDFAWCILIDAVDIPANIIDSALIALFGVGIVADIGVDVIQGVASFLIFEDPDVWVIGTGEDALLVPPLDVFPSFTAYYILTKLNLR